MSALPGFYSPQAQQNEERGVLFRMRERLALAFGAFFQVRMIHFRKVAPLLEPTFSRLHYNVRKSRPILSENRDDG